MFEDLVAEHQLTVGKTLWVDNDELSFNEIVRQAIASGELNRPKYELPVPYVSISQIETFLKCPLQYEFRYVTGVKSPAHSSMAQGSAMHKVVELGYNYKRMSGEVPPLEFVLDSYSDAFKYHFTDEVIREEHETDDFIHKQAELLLNSWYKNKLGKVNPVAVEQKFVVEINGIPVVGVIDLIDRVLDIQPPINNRFSPIGDKLVDNKVLSKMMSQADADNSLQMSVYAGVTGITEQRFDVFIKGNPKTILENSKRTKPPRIEEITTLRSQKDFIWAGKIIERIAQAISSGIFPPCAPGSWVCNPNFCANWSQCRGSI